MQIYALKFSTIYQLLTCFDKLTVHASPNNTHKTMVSPFISRFISIAKKLERKKYIHVPRDKRCFGTLELEKGSKLPDVNALTV